MDGHKLHIIIVVTWFGVSFGVSFVFLLPLKNVSLTLIAIINITLFAGNNVCDKLITNMYILSCFYTSFCKS